MSWGITELSKRDGVAFNFVTLTMPPHLSVGGTLARWRACWPALSARMRRAVGGRFHYVYVHERHRSGRLHAHIITSAPMKTRWYKDNGAQTGFGYIADCRPVDDAVHAAEYVSKYLAKSLNGAEPWPNNWRRIVTSQGWPKLPKPESNGYDWVYLGRDVSISGEIGRLRRGGFTVYMAGHVGAWPVVSEIKDLGVNFVDMEFRP